MRLAGLILAGGRSSRMAGRNKALALLAGKTLAAQAAARLSPQVGPIVLSANDEALRGIVPGLDIVADGDDSRAGPLAGILAGLLWASSLDRPPQALVSIAVDTPFFPSDLAARLAAASGDGRTIAVAATGGARHPTFALWPLGLADELAAYLAAGERRAGAFIAAQPHVTVEFAPAGRQDPFFNINTPADLAEAEAMTRRLP
jgi:molybdopterin-guanine dinucleotide biosynthesis protein A